LDNGSGLGVVVPHTGYLCSHITTPRSTVLPAGGAAAAIILSTKHVVMPSSGLYYGGWVVQAYSVSVPAGLHIIQRLGLMFFDANFTRVGEHYVDVEIGEPGGVWVQRSNTCRTPWNAAYVAFQCAAFNIGSAVATPSDGECAEMYFDDCWIMQQYDSSSVFNPQGSVIPNQLMVIAYSVTNSSVNFSWSAQSMLRSDGSTLTVQAGSIGSAGLSASTTYYTYWYVEVTTGLLKTTNGWPPPSSPSAPTALQTGMDGRIPVGTVSVTTLAADNYGTGGGTGGGGDTCPEAAELVELEGKGQIPAGQVRQGDRIKGKSFTSGEDVFREVIQVNSQSCVAWRIVNGHKVSPCEPVYVDGQWIPAYRAAGATFDPTPGTKILISVASDQYDEQNYYLVAGERLLIHNLQAEMGRFSPC
jgi:hypothetical protein